MLASQSPRRRELLKLLGLPFEATVADVREAARAAREGVLVEGSPQRARG